MSVSASPSHRCPVCKSTLVNARNLAVFIDGTSNQPGDEETNVFKLFNLVSVQDPELKQRAYYLEGIGAHGIGSLWDKISSVPEMAIARSVKKNVIEAYTWLVETYQKGDQIYLFGFSRGAYQVRALAGMIHEVGLLEEKNKDRIESAYHHYLSIDPNKPETRNAVIKFKKAFCCYGVRIHFVGVWDTVSSLGFIKKDVHVTASASVTNTCHFRHALALDERRVNFMPEFFSEVNAHRINIKSQRSSDSDVKEVWFGGCHSDVGGTSRPHTKVLSDLDECSPVHAGNVPLLWMRREAEAAGLVFQSGRFAWYPEDVDLGREDTMTFWWKFFEIFPIRHQISFSGTGKHERRWHLFRPRLVIPHQYIHFSVLPGDVYTPRATLGYGVHISTLPQRASCGLWTPGLVDEGAILKSLLSDPQETLKYLWEVLLLLHRRLENGETQTIPNPQSIEATISKLSGFDKFALTVVYDATSNSEIPVGLLDSARKELCAILSSPKLVDITRTLYSLQFSARHRRLRQHFIADKKVIGTLMHALEWTTEGRSENLFPLVMDSLCYLIDDDDQRGSVISELDTSSDGTQDGKTRLSSVLEVNITSHLKASLRMIASLARHQPALCRDLKPRVIVLAKKRSGPVASAAVEVLVALQEPLTRGIRFSTILGYLDNTLPRLDAEVGSTYSPRNTGDLPSVLRVNGSGELDEEVMHKLLRSMESSCVDRRTRATFTLLKLCNYLTTRLFCSRNNVLDIFMRQLQRKGTSLLAAYALKTCLRHNMWAPNDFSRAARHIVAMFNKGWFDDAVGQVEGSKIFDELMTSDDLRQQVIGFGIVTSIMKKFEGGEHHEVRMSLICLEILGRMDPMEMTDIVDNSLNWLRDKDKNVQKRGVKILSALARTAAGERAIEPRVIDIVNMLLPPSDPPPAPLPRSQLEAPTAALYDLCRNETLREKIKASREFSTLADRHRAGTLYPRTSVIRSRN